MRRECEVRGVEKENITLCEGGQRNVSIKAGLHIPGTVVERVPVSDSFTTHQTRRARRK